jgi:hypothetical protein
MIAKTNNPTGNFLMEKYFLKISVQSSIPEDLTWAQTKIIAS